MQDKITLNAVRFVSKQPRCGWRHKYVQASRWRKFYPLPSLLDLPVLWYEKCLCFFANLWSSSNITGIAHSYHLNLPHVTTCHPCDCAQEPFREHLRPIIETDSSRWSESVKALSPPPNVFISALGTTKAQAGSIEAQRKIDYDLNLSLAQAAKDAGIQVYVLISSDAVSRKSMFPYSRMKAELEDAVQSLDFPHTVILKPGLLVGTRSESRPAEAAIRGIAKGLRSISKSLTDFWAQDADVIGKAAVAASVQCIEGKREKGTWVISQSEIIRLGRTEWKANGGAS